MFSIWVRARFVVEGWLLRIAVVVVPRLPHGLLRLGAKALGTFASMVDYRGRAAALTNLDVTFPLLTVRQRKQLRRQSYQIFARAFAELFWSRNLTAENLARFATAYYQSEATQQAMQDGCIFATVHVGNFEWLSRATAFWGYPSMIVAANFLNPHLTPIFQALRQVEGHQIIPQENAVLRLFKHLKRGGRTALLVDLNVAPDQSATVISCFGKLTCVTQAHAALAQRTGRPLVPAISLPQPDGRYQMRFLEPIPVGPTDSLQSITQKCWNQFEPLIQAHPEIWMWMYKHWRYLPEGAAPAEYPSYANRSKKFDKLHRTVVAG